MIQDATHRQYANERKREPAEADLERGRKRRLIETLQDAQQLGWELMEVWDDE